MNTSQEVELRALVETLSMDDLPSAAAVILEAWLITQPARPGALEAFLVRMLDNLLDDESRITLQRQFKEFGSKDIGSP